MGTEKLLFQLSVFSWPPCQTGLAAENHRVLLLMQPLEEFLKPSVSQDGLHRIEGVPKLVMTPVLWMKSSQEWHVGTISVPPLQCGTT
jgi:hypothetical protein